MKLCPFCAEEIQDDAVLCRHCKSSLVVPAPTTVAQTRPPAGQGISCEKCKSGTMGSTKVPRFSEGLRLIGFTIWIPSVLLLAGATLFYLMAVVGSGTVATTTVADSVTPPLNERLTQIPGLSPAFLEASKDGRVEEEDWKLVAADARERAREIVATYEAEASMKTAATAGAALGTAAVTGVGGCGLVVTYFILVPLFIIGLVLTMKRSVWKCTNCGFIYDRA